MPSPSSLVATSAGVEASKKGRFCPALLWLSCSLVRAVWLLVTCATGALIVTSSSSWKRVVVSVCAYATTLAAKMADTKKENFFILP